MANLSDLGIDPDDFGTWLSAILTNAGELSTAIVIANDRASAIRSMAKNILEWEGEMKEAGGFEEFIKAVKAIRRFSSYIEDRTDDGRSALESLEEANQLSLNEFGYLRRAGAL